MTPEYATLLTFSLLLLMIVAGVPLGYSTLATAVVVGTVGFGFNSLLLIAGRIYDTSTNYVLITVPLFIMMGVVMEKGGIAQALFNVLHIWTARIPGGMAVGCVLAGAIMAAMVGVVGADIITLGLVALPTMLRRGYDRRLALGVVCASGTLGTMIPPSLVLVIYGLIAGASIAELFAAALIPGLILAALYAVYVVTRCVLQPELAPMPSAEERNLPLGHKLALARHLILPIGIVCAVLGSIYAGVASPTEAAAVGTAGALLAALMTGKFGLRDVHDTIVQTGRAMGPVMWTFFGATSLVGIYTLVGGITYVSGLISGLPLPPIGVIIVMNLILIFLGMLLDWVGIALLTLPIFIPVIRQLGYDTVWFGVVFCMNMQIGYMSPPFGPSAFYLKSVTPPEIRLEDIFASVVPFMLLQGVALGLIIAFPEIVLWLPQQLR
ncbi:TRAP transporter large permease [Falsiroseomonas sp. HW251]|uniref:TRAP transporter large permease n=1 Tax=Falsiroseomonas sp. HW251 TaxID=3390998 RepID=UPI003D313EA1